MDINKQNEPVVWQDLMKECIEFWTHYSCLNELGQDNITGEKDAILERMRAAVAKTPPASVVAQGEPVPLYEDTKHQAVAWLQVCELLNEVSPNWQQKGKRGVDAALQAVRELKAPAVAVNEQLLEALKNVTVHLIAAHSLLKQGGKKATASDTMFNTMLSDYEKSFEDGHSAIAAAEVQIKEQP